MKSALRYREKQLILSKDVRLGVDPTYWEVRGCHALLL
jgi:hypothetical protein